MSEDGSLSQSQLLSRSTSSLPPSSSKHISQIYKQASQLFLTRRLSESLSALNPVTTPTPDDQQQQQPAEDTARDSAGATAAPIATASSNLRIKVWNLYITLLSAIVDLGPDEGKRQFGQKEWKAFASKVRDGEIWETVVQVGYKGREGSVDADVVYNLATLLLNHSASQKLNQQRLETYLSSYGLPDHLDVSAHLDGTEPDRQRKPGGVSPANGADTPKDLAVRVKLLEMLTLHVLPRNEEWDYAREFINVSEVLDDDRKEAFLQTLDGLLEEKQRGTERAAELEREKEEELERKRKERERERQDEEQDDANRESDAHAQRQPQQQVSSNHHRRTGSEVDYGIEKSNPNGSARSPRTPKSALKSSKTAGGSPSSPSASSPKPISNRGAAQKRTPPTPSSSSPSSSSILPFRAGITRLRALASLLITLVKSASRSLVANPLAFLRTLLLVLGFVMAMGRPDVRERIRRVTAKGWDKVRGTVGMGVKVSYI